jgi:hypothetical protein
MRSTLRAVDPPLGNYLRPGRNDHTVFQQLLSESRPVATGLVIDATLITRQEDLAHEAGRQGIETVLDPRSVDLSTPAGFLLAGVSDLPWAPRTPHVPEELSGPTGLLMAEELAEFVVDHALSAVLAPTHIVANARDPWLSVDAELVQHLRRALDARARADTPIYYPLVLRSQVFYDEEERKRLAAHLELLPIDAVWIRVHPFGTTSSGPLALRRYIHACRDLHQLGVPLVADHTGTVGLPLLAFGAVGGIESGVTLGERFSLDRYTRSSDGAGFLPPPRVYIADLGAMLTRDQARSLYSRRGMRAAHGCQDQRCCPRGWQDSIANPRRHFVVRRSSEIGQLTRTPPELRPNIYLNDFLRPASDAAIRAAAAEPALEPARKRLDSWRATLGALLTDGLPPTYSTAPSGHRIGLRDSS